MVVATPMHQDQESSAQDDGWRVISRRRRESKNYDHTVGFSQVPRVVDVVQGFSLGEDGGEEGEIFYPP